MIFTNRILFAPGAGFEPATSSLTGRRSTTELSRNIFNYSKIIKKIQMIEDEL